VVESGDTVHDLLSPNLPSKSSSSNMSQQKSVGVEVVWVITVWDGNVPLTDWVSPNKESADW